jgi:hypothetical protein
MNIYASTVRRQLGVSVKNGSSDLTSAFPVSDMTKKYQLFRRKHTLPGGGFIESFVMGIAEFSCLGEQHFDVAGYPHESEFDAFGEDWSNLTEDAAIAYKKMKEETK